MRNMKKYIYLFIMLVCIMSSCTRPEDGLVIPPSINANLTRFRVYQNQNIYFDATIDQEAHTVCLERSGSNTGIGRNARFYQSGGIYSCVSKW